MSQLALTVELPASDCRTVAVETVRRGDVFVGAAGDLVVAAPSPVLRRVRVRLASGAGWVFRLADRRTTVPYPDGTEIELVA